jgi:predicted ATPase
VLFIGPNNSGKSVIASIMYASLSQTSVATTPWLRRARPGIQLSTLGDDLLDEASTFLRGLPDLNEIPAFEQIPTNMRAFFMENMKRALHEYSLSIGDEIARTTGATLQELRRVPTKRPVNATIEVTNDSPRWTVRCNIGSATNYEESDLDLREVWSNIEPSYWMRLIDRYSPSARATTSLVWDITSELIRICFRQVPQHTRYLPAARSGILQSQKALAGALVRRSSLAGIFDLQVPAMTGVITDFLSQMIEMDPSRTGDFADEAAELERTILQGEMQLRGEPGAYLEPVYHTRSGDYPLTRASSMVSELAPVVLYLRHLLHKDEILIIEEPEASLHPGTQIAFAQCLVQIVNRGLRVILTTHSEFFLEQLNHAIVAAGVNSQHAAEAGFTRSGILSNVDVAAYFFEPSAHGTVVKQLPIDPVTGIAESTFSSVAKQLYEEAIALDRSI